MTVGEPVLFTLGGALAGAVHLALLRQNVRLWLGGGPPLAAALLPLCRLALTGGILAAAAHAGWPALLGCAGGMTAARAFALRRPHASDP